MAPIQYPRVVADHDFSDDLGARVHGTLADGRGDLIEGGDDCFEIGLEEPGSHETISFGDVRTMCAFVQSRLGLVPPGAPAQEEQPAQEEDQK